MQPHQQRVIDEKTELDTKISKLGAFIATSDKEPTIFDRLPDAEKLLLLAQHRAMLNYSGILGERIANF